MPTNYQPSSNLLKAPVSKYLLYSHYKALDQVQEMGYIPVRLFRVLYPLWRVRVDGRQRIATEFDELEWYMERGLFDAGFSSLVELASFYGLEPVFVERLVDFLRGIGHIKGNYDNLSLTELGIASVRDRVRYEDQNTSTELYFEALGSNP